MADKSKSPRQRLSDILTRQAHALFSQANAPCKQVGRTRYYHLLSSGLVELAAALVKPITAIAATEVEARDLVAKVGRDHELSILVYPRFQSMPHPELAMSIRYQGTDKPVAVRRYRKNPPILHRKELLLGVGHTQYRTAHALTVAETAAGLLDPPFHFGFKDQWENRLEAMGYEIVEYRLQNRSV